MIESAEQMKFNSFTILNLHALLSDNLLRDQRACGCLRSEQIGIAKSIYQPLAIPQLISENFQQILDEPLWKDYCLVFSPYLISSQ